jgi:hypothetical protein
MNKLKWKKEFARDILALGSWVFYVLVIGRALIKPYRPFVDQVIIAGLFLFIISLIWKEKDEYLERGVVLIVFTSLFYYSAVYSGFVIFVGILMIGSSYYLSRDWKKIFYGLLIGAIATGVGYYVPMIY